MGEAYVQFFVDVSTGRAMKNSAKYAQHPRLGPAEIFMTIACDSARKVVIRKLVKGVPTVCATARWESGTLVDRQQNVPVLPWDVLATTLADELAVAETVRDAERAAFDDGVLGAATPGPTAAREPLWKQVGLWIAAGVVLALVVAGVMIYDRFAGKHLDTGATANGAACSRDTQCASGLCQGRVCRPNAAIQRGDRCSTNAECTSGRCRGNVCVAR